MDKEFKTSCSAGFSGKFLIASLFILSGILLFARNIGWITTELFDLIVAWHSLFIILGLYSIIRRYYIRGVILLLIGAYLLIGNMSCLPVDSQAMIWPFALVIAGVIFFFKPRGRGHSMREHARRHRMWKEEAGNTQNQQQFESEDGFLRAENTFGAARHVVLDELFKGASVRISFGGTVIDLRHTHIAPGETYIDLDCSCGGVELYVPTDWKVVMKCNAFFGGCEDKRWQNGNFDKERTLVVRGKLSFGGLEIKD